jgi:alpha-tubulin suppressor-like RCC1 family protein
MYHNLRKACLGLVLGLVSIINVLGAGVAEAGTPWAWGHNAYGQLGDGTFTPYRDFAAEVRGLSDVAAVAGGGLHSLALKSDGTVWAWGSDFEGQLGDDSSLGGVKPYPVQALVTGVKEIAAGYGHNLALQRDGTVWAWGRNYAGQVGNGNTGTNQPSPVRLILTNVVAVAAGSAHSLALKMDGTVRAWGINTACQLGNSAYNTTVVGVPVVEVSGLTNVVAVAGGGNHSLALKSDGTVWAWGANDYGQLGNGTVSECHHSPSQVSGLTNVVAVSAGGNHSLALKSDGTVWAWGRNELGQLGDGALDPVGKPLPVQVIGLTTNVVALATGDRHSLALMTDGTVWAWGANDYRQLGAGITYVNWTFPVQVSGLNGIVAIAGGGDHTLSLQSAPVAVAGADQSVRLGANVTLDGSGSSDPGGSYPLTYAWTMASRPAGSAAVLSGASTVAPTFTADVPGDFTISLVVTNARGVASVADSVVVSTANTRPVAAAGPDQAVTLLNSLVQLNGSGSYDEDGNSLSFSWRFLAVPAGSAAALANPISPTPTFVADVYGEYVVELTVSDAWSTSNPDTVVVSFANVKPVANAGNSLAVNTGEHVYLNGSGSADPNGDALTYHWSLVSKPAGSVAALNNANAVVADFVADADGTYVASLVVNDGRLDSDASNITVVATSSSSAAISTLRDVISGSTTSGTGIPGIEGLSPGDFKNPNMKNALINKINAAIDLINQSRYQEALDKLQNDILAKTNGCAVTGQPDANDWIINCSAQSPVYAGVTAAITNLTATLQ